MAPTAAEAEQHTRKAVGLAARDASGQLSPLAITRRWLMRANLDGTPVSVTSLISTLVGLDMLGLAGKKGALEMTMW